MYERVIRHQARRGGRDRSLAPHIAVVIAISVAVVAPFAWMGSIMHRFQCFKQDLAQSMVYAERHGTLEREQTTRFYTLIVDAGMGKPQSETPDQAPARVELGDGSILELWEVAIDGNQSRQGTLIRYTRTDGDAFCYDTDKLAYRDAIEMLGLG